MDPPGRRSIVAPALPNQVPMCSAVVTAAHTFATGALIRTSRSIESVTVIGVLLPVDVLPKSCTSMPGRATRELRMMGNRE
jgi:hypothetical protein